MRATNLIISEIIKTVSRLSELQEEQAIIKERSKEE